MLHLARKIAGKSQHHQHHHCCIITKGGKIVATGYNHLFMHAEMDAVRKVTTKALRQGRTQKSLVLYSFRWRKNGTWGNAKPCDKCMSAMYAKPWVEFAAIFYTNAEGQLVKL